MATTPVMDHYEYTTMEGGHFQPLEVPDVSMNAVHEWLMARLHFDQEEYLRADVRSRLCGIAVYAVKFPDGRIWDAHFAYYYPYTAGWRDKYHVERHYVPIPGIKDDAHG